MDKVLNTVRITKLFYSDEPVLLQDELNRYILTNGSIVSNIEIGDMTSISEWQGGGAIFYIQIKFDLDIINTHEGEMESFSNFEKLGLLL